MPRKANDKKSELNNENEVIRKVAKTTKKTENTKRKSTKTSSEKKASTRTTNKVAKTKVSDKKSKTTKSTTTTSKTTKTKTTTSTKSTSRTSKVKKASTLVEYYDLPFRYNQTVVKILAQTPNKLFIYWDISDEDRKTYVEKYGEDFFNNTRPYLVIKNETMNYSFEVEVNDFANSWYLNIDDSSCEYKIELIRKYIVNNDKNDSVYITSSNRLETPNNHILFDELGSSVFFRNTKTNILEEKNISSISFLNKIGQVYNIYDLYKQIYKDELISDEFQLNLPSSK